MNYYAGIGARRTPAPVLATMKTLASNLEPSGFKLRSGGAAGADSAFESGVEHPINADIFLPWRGFNNNSSHLYEPSKAAFEMAKEYHPSWGSCSPIARKFHARNCHQVLGLDLAVPVRFILCWTPGGQVCGGTGQALRIAIDKDIPIYNLGTVGWDEAFQIHYEAIQSEPMDFGIEAEEIAT